MNRGGGLRERGTAVTDRERFESDGRPRWVIYLLALLALAWGFSQFGDAFDVAILQGQTTTKTDPALSAPQAQAVDDRGALRKPPGRLGSPPRGVWVGDAVLRTTDSAARRSPALVNDLTEEDLLVLKENYSCDLAREARESCDTAYEDPEAYDRCLSLRQYFSYSRHCGFQP